MRCNICNVIVKNLDKELQNIEKKFINKYGICSICYEIGLLRKKEKGSDENERK